MLNVFGATKIHFAFRPIRLKTGNVPAQDETLNHNHVIITSTKIQK